MPIVEGELALCRSDPHSAVEAISIMVLVQGFGPKMQEVGA